MSDPKEKPRARSSEASELSEASFLDLQADENVDAQRLLQVLADLKSGGRTKVLKSAQGRP